MASVQRMAYTANEFSLVENKAGDVVFWRDPAIASTAVGANEAASSDFFDEFVMLDDSDSGASSAGSPHRPRAGGAVAPLVSMGDASLLPPGQAVVR